MLNYDFPRDIEEYVHRVGRTGRAGRSGESISFMTRRDWGQAANLIKILEEAEQVKLKNKSNIKNRLILIEFFPNNYFFLAIIFNHSIM